MFRLFILWILLMGAGSSLEASESRILFDSEGKRHSISDLENLGDSSRWFSYRMTSNCPSEADKFCFAWSLKLPTDVLPGSSLATQIRDLVSSSFSQWSHSSGIQIEPSFEGYSTSSDIPYLLSGEGEILRDEFDNPQVSSGFLVSFLAPANEEVFLGSERSKLLQFFRPDLEASSAEVLWTGIYFNESFHPWGNCNSSCLQAFSQTQYSVRALLTHQIGRALGLAAHSNPLSGLYPLFSSDRNSPWSLRLEDKQILASHYRDPNATGKLRGRVIDGSTSQGLGGIEILLLKEENRSSYLENAEWNNIYRMSWTDSEGNFVFEALPEGQYLLMSYSSLELLQNSSAFDEWVRASVGPYLSPNFYDGKTFESNREVAFYSPRLIALAASLQVVAGQETEPVELITNDLEGSNDLIEAVGANRESIPNIDREDVLARIRENLERDQQNLGSVGGCQLGGEKLSFPIFILIGLFLNLLLVCRYFRSGLDHPSR